jgi:hypothetical protein
MDRPMLFNWKNFVTDDDDDDDDDDGSAVKIATTELLAILTWVSSTNDDVSRLD